MTQSLRGPVGTPRIRSFSLPAGTVAGTPVKQGADDNTVALAGVGDTAFGVTAETDLVNKGFGGIVVEGETIALAGAAITGGQWVKADATNRLIPATVSGDKVLGRAVSTAAAAGDEFVVDVRPFVLFVPSA